MPRAHSFDSKLVLNKRSYVVSYIEAAIFSENLDFKNRTMVIAALIVTGVFLGYVYMKSSDKSTSPIQVRMDLEEGIVFDPGDSFGPEEREEIKSFAIKKVIEDEEIGTMLTGKEYSVEATIHGAHAIDEILQNSTLMRSDTRIVLETKLVVTVTITFHDGSGYNVRVNISDWSLGEPVYSDGVTPPVLFREVANRALNRTQFIP